MRAQTASASFTRPANATQYAVGDIVGSATAGDAIAAMNFPGGPIIIRRVKLYKSDDDVTAAIFRVHFFLADPYAAPVATDTGDNGPMKLASASITDYLGSFQCDMTASPDIYATAGNTAIGVPLQGTDILVPAYRPSGGAQTGIYALVEARATYTPASAEVFTLVVEYLV